MEWKGKCWTVISRKQKRDQVSCWHSVEKLEILSHWKEFRQINHLVISLVKPLLSRNFCKKCERENLCNTTSRKNKRANFKLRFHVKSEINWRRHFQRERRTVEKWKIYFHQNFFPSNQLFSNLFSKWGGFTKFFQKSV